MITQHSYLFVPCSIEILSWNFHAVERLILYSQQIQVHKTKVSYNQCIFCSSSNIMFFCVFFLLALPEPCRGKGLRLRLRHHRHHHPPSRAAAGRTHSRQSHIWPLSGGRGGGRGTDILYSAQEIEVLRPHFWEIDETMRLFATGPSLLASPRW